MRNVSFIPRPPSLVESRDVPMMIHPTYSPCLVENGILRVDRKFHVGTCLYSERLQTEIVVIAPTLGPEDQQMDFVSVPVEDLPYRVETVRCDGNYQLESGESARIEKLVERATLVYGMGFETQHYARRFGKPYIPVVEYNLRTQIEVARLPVTGMLRRAIRTAKTLFRFVGEIRDLRGAQSIHCNGYPIYEQTRRFHPNRLLYLDSRMSEEMVIESSRLEARLATLAAGRKPRILYSGRYEAMKGALDVVEVGLELFHRQVSFELDLFGKGAQLSEMRSRIERAGAQETIRVHDAIAYPDLVERSHDSDLFICCHVQDDPSCTYLEVSGSGLPIAGYDNRMWRSFASAAGNGVVTPIGKPQLLAASIASLLADLPRLENYARKGRAFALDHCFEKEFDRRIDAIREILQAAR